MKGLSLACAALCLAAFAPPASAKPGVMHEAHPAARSAPHGASPAKSGPGLWSMPAKRAAAALRAAPYYGYTPATAVGLGLLAREALVRNGYGNRFGTVTARAEPTRSTTSWAAPVTSSRVPQETPAQLPDVPSGPLILVEPFFSPDFPAPTSPPPAAAQPRIIYVNREKTAEHHAGEMPQIIYGDLPARKTNGPEIIYGDR